MPTWACWFIVNSSIILVPKKVVTFGSQAKLGPDVVYSDHEMLMNATRLREIHENWQGLYPSKHSLFMVSFTP